MTKPDIYTIGHSTRKLGEFVKLLKDFDIEEIADVRTIPKSRFNPQFNGESLKASLKKSGIRYEHLKELGGLRHAKKDSINSGWRNSSFRGYADHMQTEEFKRGIEKLEKIGHSEKTAIMCAEAVPWRCHRSLIADELSKRGWNVFHIQSPKVARKHKITPFLKIRKEQIVYPGR